MILALQLLAVLALVTFCGLALWAMLYRRAENDERPQYRRRVEESEPDEVSAFLLHYVGGPEAVKGARAAAAEDAERLHKRC